MSRTPRDQPQGASRPLIITADSELVDDLVRLAAAACTEVEVAPDPFAVGASWVEAPLVVIGHDAVLDCVRLGLPRRPRLILVAKIDRPGGHDEDVWRLGTALGVDHVVVLPAAEPWLVDRFSDALAGPDARGRIVAVVGGRGGGGASVFSAAFALTGMRMGLRPLLIDADPLGGGIDLVLGREDSAGLRWPDLARSSGRLSVPSLYEELPRVGELCVLSWDRGDLLEVAPGAMKAALDAGRRGSDLVVVDVARRPDEGGVEALRSADQVFLVVPAEVRACASASRVVSAIRPHCADLRVVVRGPAPAGLRSRDLAMTLGLPLAGLLRPEPGLAKALERGEAPALDGRGPLAELCRTLITALDVLPDGSVVA